MFMFSFNLEKKKLVFKIKLIKVAYFTKLIFIKISNWLSVYFKSLTFYSINS